MLPEWWLIEANRQSAGMSLSELATELSEAVSRQPPWDRTTVGNFLKDEHPTFEMMLAFCKRFDMPPPHFVARSYAEAVHLAKEARKYDGVPATPEVEKRKQVLNEARQQLEVTVRDQTQRLDSMDEEGSSSRRRPRGVVRSRSTPS